MCGIVAVFGTCQSEKLRNQVLEMSGKIRHRGPDWSGIYSSKSAILAHDGCYLFDHACRPLLGDFFKKVSKEIIGEKYSNSNDVDNQELIEVNEIIRAHPIEIIGKKLRDSMTNMKKIIWSLLIKKLFNYDIFRYDF